jgi:biotin carboxylase
MTEKYFISTNPRISGSHTVHRQGCPFLPVPGIRILLGVFPSPWEALKEGRRYFRRADSCPFCLKEPNEMKRRTFIVTQANPDLISSARMKKVTWESLMFFSVS